MNQNMNQMKRKTSGVKDGSTQEIFDYVNKNMGLMDATLNSVFYGEEGRRTFVRIESDYFFPSDLERFQEAGLKFIFVASGIRKQLTICLEVL